jgi:hypothetical protein
MGVSLDLRKAHKHHRTGDLVVVLTWVNDERALVLLPALRRDAGWYIVAESAAWRWAVDHPDRSMSRPAMEHAVAQSHIACSVLGLEPSKINRARIISIVTGWIPDLIRMPGAPEPEYLPGSIGQSILTADGAPVAAEDVKIEKTGVMYG